MTDKTPEGRKSDTMPLKASDMRERALWLAGLPDDTPGDFELLVRAIELSLIQAEKEGFERGIQKAIEVFRDHNGQEECRCNRSPVVHMPWNELLPSQDPREKSRIEREGK